MVRQRARFGSYEVDLHSGELSKKGTRLRLQPQPVQILAALLERPGELVTREELQRRLWPDDTFVDFERGLNTAIKKLRAALCDEADTPRYIETLPRRGYRFIAEVSMPPETSQIPEQVQPAQPPAASPSPTYKSRWLAVAVSALLLLALVFGLMYDQLFPKAPRIVGTRRLTHDGVEKSECCLATDGTRLYFSERKGGDRWVLAQVATRGGEISEIPVHATGYLQIVAISPTDSELLWASFPPLTTWTLPLPAGSQRQVPIPSDARWALWNHAGDEVLYTSANNQELIEVNLDGSKRTRLYAAESIHTPVLSPDGSQIRYWKFPDVEHGNVWEIRPDGTGSHPVYPVLKGDISPPSGVCRCESGFGGWTANGKLFFFLRSNGASTSLWAARERGRLQLRHPQPILLYTGPLQLTSVISSKDGKELYARGAEFRGELSILDPKTSAASPFLDGLSGCYVTFSPDRQWIAYVSYPEGQLWKSRIEGSEKMQITFPPMGVMNPRWSPDGKFIVFMEWLSSKHHSIFIVPAEGGTPRLLLTGPSSLDDPTWSPDSHAIAYSIAPAEKASHIEILNLDTMQSEPVPGSEGLGSPVWSPDGRHMAALTYEAMSRLMLYNFADGKWRPLPAEGNIEGDIAWPDWSHDNKFVYAWSEKGNKIFRVNIKSGKAEDVASVEGIHWTALFVGIYGWFGLTPDDRIMFLRDTGSEEIYALQLDY
jgi:DNA-binding winged helix-turn-helix (wHTH) protein